MALGIAMMLSYIPFAIGVFLEERDRREAERRKH
jgi:uncharacterized membrane protein